jgi:hypothetical protein
MDFAPPPAGAEVCATASNGAAAKRLTISAQRLIIGRSVRDSGYNYVYGDAQR